MTNKTITKRFYLTTPLYYVNSRPHIGHSYTNIAADTLARFMRLRYGKDHVHFLTGTDEHGQKIDKAAQAAGMAPQEFVDKISATFKDLWTKLDISYDDFIRTTEPRHVKAVQAVWKELEKRGRVYKAGYSGWYCTPDETFWTEGQVFQENGKNLCPECKRPVERIEEENYFLKMSDKQEWLIRTIREAKDLVILPETRRNEVLGFLENNVLQDLCISRPKNRLLWGIPSPLSDAHVTYVWFDALINYISAVGYGVDEKLQKKWWPADVHIIGKDILRHHAVYWPILLEALGLPTPKMIFAHGWWVQGGEKMSKSRGNVVDPLEIVDRFGVDAYRYFLLREASFGQDGTFSEEAFILRYNTDLANDLGNLLNRTLTMCEKYFEGEIPAFNPEKMQKLSYDEANPDEIAKLIFKNRATLEAMASNLPDKILELMRRLAFSEVLAEVWAIVSEANKYIERSAPWALAKQGKFEELRCVINTLAGVLKVTARAVWPFMPTIGKEIWTQLGMKESIEKNIFIKGSVDEYFLTGGVVSKAAPLFPRIESKKGDLT
ncbi:MAG: methionine--tRNA ligase [Candidatus Omnitrophica bacterium]|nr:methionine--tRNA ligase [Candidatus Omnitrophota bacterium]